MSVLVRQMRVVKPLSWAVISLLVVFFIRLAIVGLFEIGDSNDSGWYYSVAQLVAEKGVYGTRLNTIANEDIVAISIHDRPAVQNAEGYELFPSGVTVGPAFILPQALVFKLLGVNQFSRTFFPLLGFIILVILCCLLIKDISSTKGVLVFALFLILNPRLSVPLAIQAYAEPVGMAYLIGGVSVFYWAIKKHVKVIPHPIILFVGLLLGLSILTKTIYLIGVVVAWLMITLWLDKSDKKKFLRQMAILSLGIVLPLVAFEMYRFATLFQLAGIEAWLANVNATITVFIDYGSGVYRTSLVPSLSELVSKVGSFKSAGVVVALLIPGLLGMKTVFMKNDVHSRRLFLTLGSLLSAYCFWFVFFNTTGWFRHLWPGAFLLTTMTAIFVAGLGRRLLLITVVLVVVISFTLNWESTWNINKMVLGYQDNFQKNGVAQIPMPIIQQKDQSGMIDSIGMLSQDEILYYERNIFVGELLSTGRKMQPIARARNLPVYLVIGSAQQGPYALVAAEDLAAVKTNLCSEVIYDSTYYALCRVDRYGQLTE